jgi:hypothetical protein
MLAGYTAYASANGTETSMLLLLKYYLPQNFVHLRLYLQVTKLFSQVIIKAIWGHVVVILSCLQDSSSWSTPHLSTYTFFYLHMLLPVFIRSTDHLLKNILGRHYEPNLTRSMKKSSRPLAVLSGNRRPAWFIDRRFPAHLLRPLLSDHLMSTAARRCMLCGNTTAAATMH